MNTKTLDKVLTILQKEVITYNVPIVTLVAERTRDPFRVLISTMLSLRTKDEVTTVASRRLFGKAVTPQEMLRLPSEQIQKLIYPVGFYKTKADNILKVCRILVDEYEGNVPDDLDRLLKFPGVGRKTANLVVTLGFGKPGICVDTHVHRIPNRLGWISTDAPEQTERSLEEILPERFWIEINRVLVRFGQLVCTPVSPRCSICPLSGLCPRIGVGRSR